VIASLLVLLIVGTVVLIACVVVLALLGALLSMVVGLIGFLLFKVVPLLLLGWLVVKLVQRSGSSERIAASDAAWLDR
jgi:hypothetical protein